MDYSTIESMGCHLQDVHEEELLHNSLETLLSRSTVQALGIKLCPLCSAFGPEDSPELIDHVLQHTYDFALRAIPWPQPIEYDLNILPGSFTLPKDSDHRKDIQHWIQGAIHNSVGPPELQLSYYDRADHSATVPVNQYSDYFAWNWYFDHNSEDRSSKTQFEQSAAFTFSTMSTHSDITSRVVNSAAFSVDGRQVASAFGENIVKIWDIETGQITKRLKGHNSKILSVAFSPQNQQLASASVDYDIKIWDLETEVCFQTLMGYDGTIKSIVFSHNAQQLASASGCNAVKIWDIRTGWCVQTIKNGFREFTSLAFSPNSQQLASSDSLVKGTISIWDIRTGQLGHTLAGHTDAVSSLAFSPNDQELASASCNGFVVLWNIERCECKWLSRGHDEPVNSVAYFPNGQQLASASSHSIRIWDVATGGHIITYEDQGASISSIMIAPGSKQLLSASDDNTIRVWDIATGTCTKTLMLKDQATEHIEGYTCHTHSDYTIGWVCDSIEGQLAALYMLDDKHEDLPYPVDGDNTYILGKIGGHNAVVACPLKSRNDKDDARTTTQMMSNFPNIAICLMIGTGSSISPKVRLGDAVVSWSHIGYPTVLQRNMKNDEPMKRTGPLSNLPGALLTALTKFQADTLSHYQVLNHINYVQTREDIPRNFIKSHLPEDLLFKSDYNHISRIPDSSHKNNEEGYCQLCDKSMIVDRPPSKNNFGIHYGLIASVNRAVIDANLRKKLKECHTDITCVDTEVANIIHDEFPCIFIRGICDYADSHKNKAWQGYAAVTAAACAKVLLTALPVREVLRLEAIKGKQIHKIPSLANAKLTFKTRHCLAGYHG